ncbi:AAA-type ATPase lid domain-containing protein [Gracilibacillus oryzae]|nr:helix-turn-helix domain-containing protein [Gracilibacillus oryzae]
MLFANDGQFDNITSETIIKNFPFGLLILNGSKQIEEINEHAINYMGIDKNTPLIGESLSRFMSLDMVESVWQQRKVVFRTETLLNNGEKVFCTYSPILDKKGITIKTFIIIEEYDSFIEKVREQTDHYPMTELIPLIAEYSPDAVSFILPNFEKSYYNNKWNLLVEQMCKYEKNARTELNMVLAQIVKDTIKQRRKIIQVVTIGNNLEIEITSKPIIISGKLYGCFQMIKDYKEVNKYKRQYQLATSIIRKLEKSYLMDDLVGESFEVIMAKKQAILYSNMNVPVFLKGEQGTGKELMARALHFDSKRKEYPFKIVRVNGKEENLEAILFGEGSNSGILQEVRKGTLFIDECMAFPKQILNRIAERIENDTADDLFQLIVSTSNLDEALPRSLFFDWISRYQVELPPLKKRKEDIELLTGHFIEQYNSRYKTNIHSIDKDLLTLFQQYDWPKNIAELESLIESAVLKADYSETVLRKELLPAHLFSELEKKEPTFSEGMELQQAIDSFEKDYIKTTLENNHFNKTKTAKQLGISIRSLYYKMDKYHMDRGSS